MARFDLPLDELRDYLPELEEPADFEAFWAGTLAETRGYDLALTAVPVDAGFSVLEVFDVTFAGFGGHPVRAWLTVPRAAEGPLPVVVQFNGYGGGRGLAHQHPGWAAAGFAHLFMDTRGQGSGWGTGGDTADPVGFGPATPGFMTRGILDPEQHYFRRLYTDAVRAVDAALALGSAVPGYSFDATRIAVTGGSQGGALTLAAAGLHPGVAVAMPDVPFLAHFRRAFDITDAFPYGEVVKYLSVHRGSDEQVLRTLSYLDVVNHARRASAPGLFSVGMRDPVTPPSTVFAAYNRYGELAGGGAAGAGAAGVAGAGAVPKDIVVYEFNQHEGGEAYQWSHQLAWLRTHLPVAG